jgi:hypothetical protein
MIANIPERRGLGPERRGLGPERMAGFQEALGSGKSNIGLGDMFLPQRLPGTELPYYIMT